MNKASDKFISEVTITSEAERRELIKEIKIYLNKTCNYHGIDLCHQAAFAILPDEHYANRPKTTLTNDDRAEFSEYVSTTLVLINKAAKTFWFEDQKSKGKNPYKRAAIIKTLNNSEWGFTAKLADAAAAIITLNAKS